MTAEVAIITRHAIALAADSAVTVGREKVWKTANKLFSLGPKHDIAIMIYGAGDFLSLPWEVAIKEYRRRHAYKKPFNTVQECADDLRRFLASSVFDVEKPQRYSVLFPLYEILEFISDKTRDAASGSYDLQTVRNEFDAFRRYLRGRDVVLPDLESDFSEPFMQRLTEIAEKYFDVNVVVAIESDLRGLAYDFFRSNFQSRFSSGVVVAGFGSDQLFPCLVHFTIDGRWKDWLRWWPESGKDLNDPSEDADFPIFTFAQQDMPFLFMAGISPNYLRFLEDSLSKLMEDTSSDLIADYVDPANQAGAMTAAQQSAQDTVSKFMDKFVAKVREEQFAPINRAVSALPKEEMAMMAEALVDLTSLRRKVDSKLESVGGPVDVAVISKGDGFVWMKRKYYFDAALNHDFIRRKNTQCPERRRPR